MGSNANASHLHVYRFFFFGGFLGGPPHRGVGWGGFRSHRDSGRSEQNVQKTLRTNQEHNPDTGSSLSTCNKQTRATDKGVQNCPPENFVSAPTLHAILWLP